MFDGFWSGIFGGLFGPALTQWLNRFKYWVVFLFAALAWQLFAFFVGIYYRGWIGLRNIFIDEKSSFLIIFCYAPVGAGVLAVFVAFVGTLSNRKRPEDADRSDKK